MFGKLKAIVIVIIIMIKQLNKNNNFYVKFGL